MPSTSLKAARERSGYSQQEVADELQVCVVTVSRWENGHTQPPPYLLPKLCRFLERDLRDLFPDRIREGHIPSIRTGKGGVVAVAPHKLRSERLRLGLSQQEIADQLHVSRVTVSRWEQGHDVPTRYHLRSLCKLFERRPEELLPTKMPTHLPTIPLRPALTEKAQEAELETLREQLARATVTLAKLQEERTGIQSVYIDRARSKALLGLFPQTLRGVREARAMTQEQAAWELDVDPRTYQRWESGEQYPTPRHQRRITEVLKIAWVTCIGGDSSDPRGVFTH